MSFKCPPKYERHQQHLERSWDPQVTHPGPPAHGWKSDTAPDPNLKSLVVNKRLPAVHSAKTLPTRTTVDSTCSTTPSAFNSIAATFGFSHHVGTDKRLELAVLKAILKRESALENLHDTCTPKYSNKIFLQNDSGTGVLDQLTSIRDITVSLIETVTTWRQSMPHADPEIPRPFMYENQNYLLKVMFDMDFLANISPLVEALGLDGQKLQSNPLMMPQSLDRANLGTVPEESARDDANGETNSKLYIERLKLRTVEQTLLREMNFNRKGAPSVAWGEDDKTDTDVDNSFRESTTLQSSTEHTEAYTKARQADILAWYRQAQLQLIKLEEGIGEKLSADFNSTYRLRIPVPEEDPLVRMSFSPSRMMPPTTLHEHNSTAAEVPLPGPRSRTPSPTRTGTGGIRKLRRLPEQEGSHLTIASLSPALEWTRADIQVLVDLEQAPRCVALACASTLILLASGPQIPKNISWETFCLHANEAPIEEDMNAVAPGQIPQFKIRAITPFLGSLTETFEEDLSSEDPLTQLVEGQPRTEAIRKLVTWIMEVLNIATSSPEQAPPPAARVSASQSTIDSIKFRRMESNSGLKKKQASERSKCPADMKVKHTEVSEDELLPGTTITITLEIQKKKPTTSMPKRFVIKVFDENTFQFAQVAVNCKEYSSYLLDMREVFPGEELEAYFEPTSSKWWAKYLKEVSTVSNNQGTLSVRVSKKAIRSLISNQIKSKDAEEDGDLVSQDDEMASQQPLKKEKPAPEKKKKSPTAKAKKEEAAAAAAKAKANDLQKKEDKKKEQKQQQQQQQEEEKRQEREKAEEDQQRDKAEVDAKQDVADQQAADQEAADKDAADKQKAEEEEEREKADAAAKQKEEQEEEKINAAAKQKQKEEEEEAAAAAEKKRVEEETAVSQKKEEEEEENDGYDDEYDAEYDDENFVMTPKGSPQKQDQSTFEDEPTKTKDTMEEDTKTEEKEKEEEEDDGYGDEYDDDNYDDESTTKTPKKPEDKDTDKATPQEKEKEQDDYTLSDDEYEALFDEE